MLDAARVNRMLADAYFAAASAGAGMRAATESLETIRASLADPADPFLAWAVIDRQVGLAWNQELAPVLTRLRSSFREALTATLLAKLRRGFEQDPGTAWLELLDFLERAMAAWRAEFAMTLLDAGLPVPAGQTELAQMLRKGIRDCHLERWAATREMFLFFGRGAGFAVRDRAKQLSGAALVELYYYGGAAPALEILEEGQRLLGADDKESALVCALGRLHRNEQRFEPARRYLEEAITLDPASEEAYCYRGECAEAEGDLPGAEVWYRRAIQNAGGHPLGYTFLALLLVRDAEKKPDRTAIRELLERALLVDPSVQFKTLLDAARAFLNLHDHDEALSWIDRGLAMDSAWADGYYMRSEILADRKNFAGALAACEKALEADPDYYGDSTWGTLVTPEAKDFLLKTLRENPNHPVASVAAETLLGSYVRDEGDEAAGFLNALREILGEKFEAKYQNYLGNIRFQKAQYQEAAEAYRLAADLAPQTALHQSNLAEALAAMNQWEPAIEALDRMLVLDGDTKRYRTRMGTVYNSWGNQFYERSEFAAAAQRYALAREFRPDDAVIHSNYALALAQIKAPEGASAVTGAAVAALDRALELTPDRADYRKRREFLSERSRLLAKFGTQAFSRVPLAKPLRLELANDLLDEAVVPGTETLSESTLAAIASLRSWIWKVYGVTLPGLTLSRVAAAPSGWYRYGVFESPIGIGTVAAGMRLFTGSADTLQKLGIEPQPAAHPLTGESAFWVNQNEGPRLKGASQELWGAVEYPLYDFISQLRLRLASLVGVEETATLLNQREVSCRETILSSPARLGAFTRVLRGLVAECVPIVELEDIAKAFLQLSADSKGPLNCTSIVERLRSLESVRPSLPGNDGGHGYITIDPVLEHLIEEGIHERDAEAVLTLDPHTCMAMLERFRAAVSSCTEPRFILVVSEPRIRPWVRKLVELDYPRLYVSSLSELSDPNGRVIGAVTLATAEATSVT